QGLQAFGVGDVHPAILRPPVIQRCLADTVLASQIARLRSGLVLPEHRDDLLFRKPLPLHLSVLQSRPDSNSRWRKNSVAGQKASQGPVPKRKEPRPVEAERGKSGNILEIYSFNHST